MTDTNTLAPTDEAIIAWAMSHQTDAIKVLRGTGFVRVARAVLDKWGTPAPASQPFTYEFSRSNGDGTTPSADSMRLYADQVDAVTGSLLAAPAQPVALDQIEQYRMQMAGISAAAIGYWKDGDAIHDDYRTSALEDVALLYAKYDELYRSSCGQAPAQAGEYPPLPEPAMFDAVDRQGNPVSHGYSASQVRAIIDADRAARGAAQPAAQAMDADLWYLQDTRSYVGNDVVWWAKDGKGYTTDVSKAHVYGREEAFRQAAMRGTDRAWPKAYIDGKTRPAVDMQYIDHAAAIAAQEGGAA